MQHGPAKTARYYKIMFYKHIASEFSMWIDATFIINCDLNNWWGRFQPPFTTIKHPFDDCIYKDAKSCISGKKDNVSAIENQIELYKKIGIPKNNGLIASGILMRQKTEEVKRFCKTWWDQVESFSSRDQIAFGRVNHRFPNSHISIEWDYTKKEDFIHIPHLTKKWRSGRLNEIEQKYGKSISV